MRHRQMKRAGCILELLLLMPLSLAGQDTPKSQKPPEPSYSSPVLSLSFGPTASNPEGKAAAQRLLQALGGADKVKAIRSINQSVVAIQQGKQIDIEETVVYPDRQAQKVRSAQGNTLLVVTPSDAFIVQGGYARNLPPQQRAALDATLKHDFINILQHIDDPKYVFVAVGQEKVAGVDATVVDVEADDVPTRWWIGADGKLLRERYSDMSAQAAVQLMTYSDWKDFGGLHYPTKYQLFNEAGQSQLSMTLNRMEVNSPVQPSLFHRPSDN